MEFYIFATVFRLHIMKISNKRYIQWFCLIVIFLGIIRAIFPNVAPQTVNAATDSSVIDNDSIQTEQIEVKDTVSATPINETVAEAEATETESTPTETLEQQTVVADGQSRFFDAQGNPAKHRIWSVSSYRNAFPDQNDVQLTAAKKWGVSPVQNRAEAESRKAELVYVGSNPYFYVQPLRSSIPYLVPRASVLLQDIGKAFFDSLQIKGIPLHKIIVTSVMRSKDDVQRLRTHNSNATENSCHLFGTTFDICYNRYMTVQDPDGPARRQVRNDSLKWVLSEVLNDMRKQNRCFIKYEVKQGCFHMTVN